MASIMSLSLMPTVNSYASSENRLSNGNITVSEKTLFYEPGLATTPKVEENQSKVKYVTEGSYLNIKVEDEAVAKDAKFDIELENAKFAFDAKGSYIDKDAFDATKGSLDEATKKVYKRNPVVVEGVESYDYKLTVVTDTYANVVVGKDFAVDSIIKIPMVVRMDEGLSSGTAKVRIYSGNSGVSNATLSFATINKGSTTAYVQDVKTGKNKIPVEKLIIKENVAGSMAPAAGEGFYLELPSGYSFSGTPKMTGINVVLSDAEGKKPTLVYSNSNRKLTVTFPADDSLTPTKGIIGQLVITGLNIVSNSNSDSVTNEDIKVSIDNIGSREMVTAQDFTIGKSADYKVSFKADGTVPTILSGYYDADSDTNDRVKSVKVVVAEETAGSLISGGDLTLTVSDEAKIRAIKIEDKDNIDIAGFNGYYYLDSTKNADTSHVEVKAGKVKLRDISASDKAEKCKFTISFFLSVEPGYEGDITVDISGDAVRDGSKVEPMVIAKAISPVKSSVNNVVNILPGQTVEMPEIVLTEQMNSKGYSALEENKTVVLRFNNSNNYLSISGTPTVKTENGLTVKNIKVTSSGDNGSYLTMTVDDASSKNKASKITISGLKIAASASIPQGDYTLIAAGTAVAGNSTKVLDVDKASFATEGLTVAKLQYGGKIAMKITIGDKKINVNGTEVEMKVAPFIDAATGTTYMQVSDIVKATGKTCTFFDNRIQKIEGVDKNLFVTFGDRTFAKDKSIVQIAGQTLPETMTNEQGLAVNMIIKEDYACLPLRYFVEKVLGQTINWNGTDNTITVE